MQSGDIRQATGGEMETMMCNVNILQTTKFDKVFARKVLNSYRLRSIANTTVSTSW